MVDKNILLVDDDQDTCASMSDIFLDIGYTVDMAYDGPGALQLSGGKTWDHTHHATEGSRTQRHSTVSVKH